MVIYELELVNEIKGISGKLKYNYEESYDVFENSLLEDKYILGYRFNGWIDETGGVLKTSLPIKSVGNRTLKADFLGKESDYEKNKSDYKQMEGILSIRFNGADKGQQGAILYIENDYDEITLIGKSENVVGSLELINFQIVVKYRTTPVTIRFCNLKITALKGCNTVNIISGADKVTIISHGTNYIIGGEGTTGAKGIKGANMSQAAAGADGADNKEGWYINPDGDNGSGGSNGSKGAPSHLFGLIFSPSKGSSKNSGKVDGAKGEKGFNGNIIVEQIRIKVFIFYNIYNIYYYEQGNVLRKVYIGMSF